ncbi:energy transducer TonB [Halotia wernerae UHCC 0503]|nr:energy transducer TonB [Halotia wernerae UHCC 0503]
MTFSGIAVEQRSKEAESIRSFLIYSLIGSLALHLGVLSLGIFNLGKIIPEVEDEPIEVTIIDSPTLEIEKPPDEIKQEPETASARVPEKSGNTSEIDIVPQPKSQAIAPTPFKPPVIEQKQPLKLETGAVSKLSDNLKTPQVQKQEPTTQPQPAAITPQVLTSESANTQQSSPTVNQSSEKLTGLLSGLRNSATQGSSNNTNPVESNKLGSTNSNPAVDSGTSNRRPRSSGTVSTAPSPAKIEAPPSNDSPGSGNGRAACRQCGTKYPESARRRGIEGKVEVAVDTDAKGNVTNVRVINSSGNRALDEETLRQARDWKLKPAAGGREGVSISTEYAIEGSRRHRELQEKRKRQAAQERKQQAASANLTEETPRRRRRSTTSTIMDVPPETSNPSRVRQRQSTPSSGAATTKPSNQQRSVRESLRRVRRKPVTNNSSTQPKPTENRRRRTEPAPSSSQSKLQNALRRSQQQYQPSSSDTPTSTGK